MIPDLNFETPEDKGPPFVSLTSPTVQVNEAGTYFLNNQLVKGPGVFTVDYKTGKVSRVDE